MMIGIWRTIVIDGGSLVFGKLFEGSFCVRLILNCRPDSPTSWTPRGLGTSNASLPSSLLIAITAFAVGGRLV